MFKFIPQYDQMDCGPACLSMVASSYNKYYSLSYLRQNSFITREGVSLLGISTAAESIGFESYSTKPTVPDLIRNKHLLPCILHWNQNHFVVLKKIHKPLFSQSYSFQIADPGHGIINLSQERFEKAWLSDNKKGIALFLKPTNVFYEKEAVSDHGNLTLKHMLTYLKPHKKSLIWLFVFLFFGALTTLIFPFLTQKLIDEGVTEKNLSIISYILLAQLALFLGNMFFGVIRNWIMLVMGTKINIGIISDFLKKLFKLPIKYFDTKLMGDFNQRIQDHERIEQFLTSESMLTIFSLLTFTIFFGVLWYYDFSILLVYLILTTASILWSLAWMKKRNVLDYLKFQQRSENQQSIYEIINGISEIQLNQFEDYKRGKWELIQSKIFAVNRRILKLDQIQLSGFEFINQFKNILVTFLAARLVVKGEMTLGALLSVSYIIGQMNSPINQLISFFRSLQDAKLSLLRLNEIQDQPEEETEDLKPLFDKKKHSDQYAISNGILLNNLSFQYEGPQSPYVLKNNNLLIPKGKITAIVGASGSGKTTLMKLLLKFYNPTNGTILFNGSDILTLSPKSIRENCGVVMQDGYIFSDTIERNIATGDENINRQKLEHAVKVANIESFIENLPLGYNTKIGAAGNGISGGQKQRILIARAVYKNPHYILFDEATSALDAENEKIIHDNLQEFFKGKTVVIIAHRLSTVKNADQIVVLKHGEVVEQGSHQELVMQRSEYYNLVKNQLELGN